MFLFNLLLTQYHILTLVFIACNDYSMLLRFSTFSHLAHNLTRTALNSFLKQTINQN